MEFSLVQLLLVLLVAWGSGTLAQRLGYPAILGELAAGILFGPAVLGLLQPSEGLTVLAEVGVFLMMLYIGMEVDYRDLARASWGGLLAALGGFCVPMALGFFTARWFGYDAVAGLFLGLAMGVTSLATKSRILVDLNILGTRIAGVLFAGAMICDTAALVVFAAIMGLSSEQGIDFGNLSTVLGKAVLFFGVTILLGLRVFPAIGPLLRKIGFTERTANFTLVVMIGLVFAELAELAGLHAILGAFLAGMFLRDEVMKRKVSHEVTTLVGDVSLGFLAPIFFVTVGFHVDFGVFITELPMLLLIIVLAFAGKILGTALSYLPSGHGWREGVTIGFGMNGRGAVEIIIAGIALERGLINESLFSILVFMAFATTASVPVFMKWGVSWLRGRGELARTDDRRNGVLIVGATPLARMLAHEFEADHVVTLIDTNERRCGIAEREGLRVFPGMPCTRMCWTWPARTKPGCSLP
jgi:Kef-type K+ transport system membrane component KefB